MQKIRQTRDDIKSTTLNQPEQFSTLSHNLVILVSYVIGGTSLALATVGPSDALGIKPYTTSQSTSAPQQTIYLT